MSAALQKITTVTVDMDRFDYSILAADIAAEARAAASRFRARKQKQVEAIIETGQDLLAVKVKLDHGQFGKWLEAEFDMDERSAQRFMSAAVAFEGKSDTVSDLTATTIYLLSAPSTPATVREDVVKRLESGTRLYDHNIKSMVKEAKRVEKKTRRRRALKKVREEYRSPRAQKARENERLQFEEYEAGRKESAKKAAAIIIAGCGDSLPALIELLENCSMYKLIEELKST